MVKPIGPICNFDCKSSKLPKFCRECDARFACHGECPKHRFTKTPGGKDGLNYLCSSYKKFFHHVDSYMKQMTAFMQARQAPANIMDMDFDALKK
jgi:uncharacterized protein